MLFRSQSKNAAFLEGMSSSSDLVDAELNLAKVRAERMQAANQASQTITPDSIRMAATMIATIPIIMVYPFIQKYFVKGIMLGSVKS